MSLRFSLLFLSIIFLSTRWIQGQRHFQFSPINTNNEKLDREKLVEESSSEDKDQIGHEPKFRSEQRKLLNLRRTKAISELCGTSSSVTCALKNDLVTSNTNAESVDDTWKRCEARKEFLACIEAERNKCQNFAEEGYYPLLPSKSKVKIIQDNAWKNLWTSGACVLQA